MRRDSRLRRRRRSAVQGVGGWGGRRRPGWRREAAELRKSGLPEGAMPVEHREDGGGGGSLSGGVGEEARQRPRPAGVVRAVGGGRRRRRPQIRS